MERAKAIPVMFAVSVVLCLAACNDAVLPTETDDPVFAVVQNDWIPQDRLISNHCAGEQMHFVGRYKILRTSTDDGAGGYHIVWGRTWTGIATGQLTGHVYNINFNYSRKWHAQPPFPSVYAYVIRNNVHSRNGGPVQVWKTRAHTTVNANGEVTTDFYESTFECLGR